MDINSMDLTRLSVLELQQLAGKVQVELHKRLFQNVDQRFETGILIHEDQDVGEAMRKVVDLREQKSE